MHISTLLAASVLAMSIYGARAAPVDGEDMDVDPESLSQALDSGQQSGAPVDGEDDTIDPALLSLPAGSGQQSGAPVDGEGGTIDPALLHQPAGSSQESGSKPGHPDLKVYEERGRLQVNAWLFAKDLNELDQLLVKYTKHPDPKSHQWQRSQIGRNFLKTYWKCEDMTQSLGGNQLGGFEESIAQLTISPPAGLPVQKPEIIQPSTAVYPDGPWVKMKVTQDKKYQAYTFAKWPVDKTKVSSDGSIKYVPPPIKGSKKEYQATGASYETLYNIVDGIMIIESLNKVRQHDGNAASSSTQPAQQLLTDLQLPDPYGWGDVTSYVWNDLRRDVEGLGSTSNSFCLCHDGKQNEFYNRLASLWPHGDTTREIRIERQTSIYYWPNHLNYIIVPDVADDNLLQILREYLLSRDVRKAPTMDNREKFGVGHWCFYSILGAPESYEIGLLLAHHRASNSKMLGHKVIKSISIFKPAEKNRPSLLFSIVDHDHKWDLAQAAIEAEWLSDLSSRGGKYEPVTKDVDCWDL